MNTIDHLRAEIRDLEIERNNAVCESDRLQTDLYEVTQEKVHLERILETSRIETEELKAQLKFYCSEVQRFEEDLCCKENERADVLTHLKFLSLEATELETNKKCLSEELCNCKQKLTEAEKEIMRLEACIEEKECTIKSLEGKLQELACLTTQLEEHLRCTQQEKYCQGQELAHCQQTLQELLMQKEALCHQLTTCESCKTQIEEELRERKCCISILQDELAKERHHSSNLEDLMRKTKMEMHDVCLCNQRYQEEILGLSEKIQFLCAKLEEEKQENVNFHMNIETLRKQIMTSRHEKSYSMKEELKQNQRMSMSMATGKDHVRMSDLSKPKHMSPSHFNGNAFKMKKDCYQRNMMKSNQRYSIVSGEPAVRHPSKSYACHSNFHKGGESANRFYNENVKEADLRYQLYLENLNKIQSYAKIYKNQKKKPPRHYKENNSKNGNNRKLLDDGTESINMEYERLDTEADNNLSITASNTNSHGEPYEKPVSKSGKPDKSKTKNDNNNYAEDIKENILERVSKQLDNNEENAEGQPKSAPESSKSINNKNLSQNNKSRNKAVSNSSGQNEVNTSKNMDTNVSKNNNFSNEQQSKRPPTSTTVQYFNTACTIPAKTIIQQTYFVQKKFRQETKQKSSENDQESIKISNDSYKKLKKRLKSLKPLENDDPITTNSSSEFGGGSVNSKNNMYVNIANKLHEIISEKKDIEK